MHRGGEAVLVVTWECPTGTLMEWDGHFPEGVIVGMSVIDGEIEVIGRGNSLEVETERTQWGWSAVRGINERAGDMLPS